MKVLFCGLIIASLAMSVLVSGTQPISAKTRTKDIIICKITNKSITYRKSIFASKYFKKSVGWENIIGYGKAKKIKISKNAKYYMINYNKNALKAVKATKKKFMKQIIQFDSKRYKEHGQVYFTGIACKITIKKGKIVKIKQVFQA